MRLVKRSGIINDNNEGFARMNNGTLRWQLRTTATMEAN